MSDYEPPERAKPRSRKIHATKLLVAQTSWLDGVLRCQEGKVAWEHDGTAYVPESEDIAKTQRLLYKLKRDYEASSKVVGDFDAWMKERSARLELAKSLKQIDFAEIKTRIEKSKIPEVVIPVLLQVLIAEALCVNALPFSAVLAFLKIGTVAVPPLLEVVGNVAIPLAARALAAMVIGAIKSQAASRAAADIAVKSNIAWINNAFKYGAQFGAPKDAQTVIRFLSGSNSTELVKRFHAAIGNLKALKPEPESVNQMFVRGMEPKQVVELIEGVLRLETLLKSLKTVKSDISHLKSIDKKRRNADDQLRDTLRDALQIHALAYAVDTSDVESVALLEEFVDKVLLAANAATTKTYLGAPAIALTAAKILEAGTTVRTDRRCDFLLLMNLTFFEMLDLADIGSYPNLDALRKHLNETLSHDVNHVPAMLNSFDDIKCLYVAGQKNLLGGLSHVQHEDEEVIALTVQCSANLKASSCGLVEEVVALVKACRQEPSKVALRQIVSALPRLCSNPGYVIRWIHQKLVQHTNVSLREGCEIAARCMPLLEKTKARYPAFDVDTFIMAVLPAAIAARGFSRDSFNSCLQWYCDFLAETFADGRTLPSGTLSTAGLIAGLLSEGTYSLYVSIVTTSVSKLIRIDNDVLATGLPDLSRMPNLRKKIRRAFLQQPGGCLSFFRMLWLASRIGPYLVEPLNSLDISVGQLCDDPACQFVKSLSEDSQRSYGAYHVYLQLAGAPHEIPGSLKKQLARDESLTQELIFLQQKFKEPRPAKIAARIENLKGSVKSPVLNARVLDAIIERIEAQAALEAASVLLMKGFRQRLAVMAGEEAFDGQPLLEAFILRHTVNENGDLLRRMLRAYVRGDIHWARRQPKTLAYLRTLREQGFDVELWLAPPTVIIDLPDFPSGPVRLHVEDDPLEILQMGNYFGTCLSFDGINSHSSIANASDINKRVIYARDAQGRVVGRKLVAINNNLQLVGYNVYCALTKKQGHAALLRAINKYARELATQCGLLLGNSGSVDKILSEEWYDDGTVDWPSEASADVTSLMPSSCGKKDKRGATFHASTLAR